MVPQPGLPVSKHVVFTLSRFHSDDIAHVSDDELNTMEVIDTIKNVTDLLSGNFPNITVYPCLGNHDYHPKHLMPPKPNEIYEQVGDLWSRWLPSDAVATFKQGLDTMVLTSFKTCVLV